jgi:hypothetical protein
MLVHREVFTGILTWFVREGSAGGIKTRDGFERLSVEIREEVERRRREGGSE